MRVRETARITLLNDITVFHVHHAAGGFARHFHFVGYDDLSNIGFRQLTNDADDLGGDFRVQRRSRLIKRLCRIKKSSDNMLFFFAMLPDYAVDPKSLQTSALSC